MSFYLVIVYLHIVAALGLFATLAIEWAGLYQLRRAVLVSQVRDSTQLLGALRRVGGPSALLLLITGVYLSATGWGMQTWIVLGLLGLVLMASLGAVLTGRRMGPIARDLPGEGGIPPAVLQRIHDPVLVVSAWLRTALGLGVVLLMTLKPAGWLALTAFAASLIFGLAIGLAAGSGRGIPTGPLSAQVR